MKFATLALLATAASAQDTPAEFPMISCVTGSDCWTQDTVDTLNAYFTDAWGTIDNTVCGVYMWEDAMDDSKDEKMICVFDTNCGDVGENGTEVYEIGCGMMDDDDEDEDGASKLFAAGTAAALMLAYAM